MIEPTGADLNRRVLYLVKGMSKSEVGVVTAFNPEWVFVRFGRDVNSKACQRADLNWEHDDGTE